LDQGWKTYFQSDLINQNNKLPSPKKMAVCCFLCCVMSLLIFQGKVIKKI